MSPTSSMSPMKILFLAANPHDTQPLQLDKEVRAIDQSLQSAAYRDRFDLVQAWAVHYDDLQNVLLRHQPTIVHFSGHGSGANELILLDNDGGSHPVSLHALSRLFAILKDNIRCVVLNACYTESQAQAIAQHIEAVIGMSNAFDDAAAIQFASAFYRALAYGRSIKTAFDLGCAQIDLSNLNEQEIPRLLVVRGDPAHLVLTNLEKSPTTSIAGTFSSDRVSNGPIFNLGGNIQAGQVNLGGTQTFEEAIAVDMSEIHIHHAKGEVLIGDKLEMPRDFQGVRMDVKSRLENVAQTINSLLIADETSKTELVKLIEELKIALTKIPKEKAEEAEKVIGRVVALAREVGEEKPEREMIIMTGESLKRAAKNIADVLPSVPPITARIITAVLNLHGI